MSDNLKVFALGGLHEVGKNCYIFEKGEDIIIVDCGIKFVNNNRLADSSIPEFSYLLEKRGKIKGLFVTHGHEDHIGGIPYLLKLIPDIPIIYGSEFTISLLKGKLRVEFHGKVKKFPDKPVTTGEFRVSFFRVTHSIPGSFGFLIEVLATDTRIVVTGDFKFDWTEIGEKTDLVKLVEYGKRGVDLLLSDSTNAEIEGSTPSETKVIKRLQKIISEASGRVIITSFASNVYRLKKVAEIAKKTGKKIFLLGSSLERMKGVIDKATSEVSESNLWKIDNSIFLKEELIGKFPNNKLIIFCTGSQGEEKAVLSRLAHQSYPDWKVAAGDSIILTSSPIMDNKFQVEIINNKLFALGAKIYENNPEDLLHASGHACQEDLKLMLKLVNPHYFMPFHGDFRMLKSHKLLAKEVGIPEKNIFVCQNGEVIEAVGKEFFLSKKKVPAQVNFVLRKKILPVEEIINNLATRGKMAQGGAILVVVFYDEKEKFVDKSLYIFTCGFIDMKKNEGLLNDWKSKISDCVKKTPPKSWEKEIKNYIENELLQNWKREKPVVHILVERK